MLNGDEVLLTAPTAKFSEEISVIANFVSVNKGSIEFEDKEYVKAINFYFSEFVQGDSSALKSLRLTIREAFKGNSSIMWEFLRDTISRRSVTAYFLSGLDDDGSTRSQLLKEMWSRALGKLVPSLSSESPRVAWFYLMMGQNDKALTWIKFCKKDDYLALWLQGKILLKRGHVEKGAQLLASIDKFGKFESSSMLARFKAELGLIMVSKRDFKAALGLFMESGHYLDVAYIAEQLISIESLIEFVEDELNSINVLSVPEEKWSADAVYPYEIEIKRSMKYVLARRLIREADYMEAFKFFPKDMTKLYQTFFDYSSVALDSTANDDERAGAYWNMALMLNERGMELMGFELFPDFAIWNGNDDKTSCGDIRLSDEYLKKSSYFPVSNEERLRLKDPTRLNKRFSFKYVAADMAWKAAKLMPDNDDRTAEMLWISGTWHKTTDPEFAEKFYRALVKRNRKTKLGMKANELRWFPPEENLEK